MVDRTWVEELVTQFPTLFGENPDIWCGEGWKDIVTDLCGSLVEVSSNLQITQIKEKFGALRVYVGVCDVSTEAA